MPAWLKESYQERTNEGDALYDVAKGMDPTKILGMNDREYDAYQKLLQSGDRSGAMLDQAYGGTAGMEGGNALDYYEQGAEGLWGKGGGSYTGDRLTDLIGGKDFELDYTDNVVDTTLSGMQRQADRDRLLRQSQQAATGGVNSTRSAVEDAIAGGETARAMAEQEAALRDSAQRFGTESLFTQAGMLDDSDRALGEQDAASAEFDKSLLDAASAANEFGMNFDLNKFGQMAGMSDQQLKQGMSMYDLMKNFGQEERMIDQANANADKEHLGWLANLLQGTHMAPTNPTGSTQTQTQPGNSGLQNALGIGTSLAGMFMMSDERVKEDVEPLDGKKALDAVMDLKPAEYRYKDGYGHRKDRHAGLIAQSAEGIPDAVVENDDGVKMLNAFPVVATIVSAVQELKREQDAKGSTVGGAGLREAHGQTA